MTIREANQKLLFRLYHDYDNREASNIADLLLEQLTGWTKIDRLLHRDVPLSAIQVNALNDYDYALEQHTPVQYILKEAWFCGLKFYVDENVLIPRPETEELVAWVLELYADGESWILDAGTGSGCIAISLKKKAGSLNVSGCDISEAALAIAKKNAQKNNVAVSFFRYDLLNGEIPDPFPSADVIVSNPPYIPEKESVMMNPNVTLHEPSLALFVPDHDPLVFYSSIIEISRKKLKRGGSIFVEVHEDNAAGVAALFNKAGYHHVDIRKDMQGKERMIRAY